jgi:hypothetical protein
MATAALIVAIVSAVSSAGAVVVSVWTHRQQGSRIECRWSNAFPIYGSQLGDSHIQVEAVNHGRSAATIAAWGFVVLDQSGRPTDTTIVMTQPLPWLPALPFRLDSESSGAWMMPANDIRGALARHDTPQRQIKAFIRTGTGRQILAPRPVDLSL